MSDPATVAVAPLILDIAQYAVLLIPVAVAWLAREQAKYTGIVFKQSVLDEFDRVAKAKAGAAILASKDNLAGLAIPAGSPFVAGLASELIAEAPSVVAALGLSPTEVAARIAGHLGDGQAAPSERAPDTVGFTKPATVGR